MVFKAAHILIVFPMSSMKEVGCNRVAEAAIIDKHRIPSRGLSTVALCLPINRWPLTLMTICEPDAKYCFLVRIIAIHSAWTQESASLLSDGSSAYFFKDEIYARFFIGYKEIGNIQVVVEQQRCFTTLSDTGCRKQADTYTAGLMSKVACEKSRHRLPCQTR